MGILKKIKERRSIRQFTDKPIKKSEIKKLLDAARWAPSASNIQGWRFIVIDDGDVKERLEEENSAYFLKDAPILIVVLYDNRTENTEYDDDVQSASAAIQNILIMAEDMGIGACWVNNIPPKKKLRNILDIPDCFDPIAIVAVGHYNKKPKPLKRKYELEDIISYNKFKSPYSKTTPGLFLKRFLRRIYLKMPRQIKKLLKPFVRRYEKKFDTEDRYR